MEQSRERQPRSSRLNHGIHPLRVLMIPGWRDENRAVEYHHQEGADGGVCNCHDRGLSLSEFSFKKQRGVSFRPT